MFACPAKFGPPALSLLLPFTHRHRGLSVEWFRYKMIAKRKPSKPTFLHPWDLLIPSYR
jgi:hypothetical protein